MELIDSGKIQQIAEYAEKHELFDLFQELLSKLIIARPADPYQFMIDYFAKPPGLSIILMVPPTSGLTETIERLARQFDVVHINTGKLLNQAYEKQKSNGVQAKPYIDRGMLVPDSIMVSVILQQLKEPEVLERGYILDGYPRTKQQALALLQAGYIPSHVVEIDIPDSGLVGAKGTNVKQNRFSRNDNDTNELTLKESNIKLYRQHIGQIKSCYTSTYTRFSFPDGVVGEEETLSRKIASCIDMKPITSAPRGFRIIVAGLPGSGKTKVAEMISEKYGPVLISAKKVMLQAISSGEGERFLPYLNNPDQVPLEIIGIDLVKRLRKPDCVQRGWVLDGFPFNSKQAEFLQLSGINPNRVIWLNTPYDTCYTRIARRRYDPISSRIVNLDKVPKDLKNVDLNTWLRARADTEEIFQGRFDNYETAERELKKFYGLRDSANPLGVMHSVQSDGVGEEDENGEQPTLKAVFDVIDGHLLRPVPNST
ncbi:adenylate kinase-domain-containing protein [Globomyces pollinis-pini]|nr:adenylate kinase-domain-containing protein [Globomyces pollinis-pini]